MDSLPTSHSPFLHSHQPNPRILKNKKTFWLPCLALSTILLLALLVYVYEDEPNGPANAKTAVSGEDKTTSFPVSRGPAQGVSEKTTSAELRDSPAFPWTSSILSWQRTAFHFQPPKNWMNDPNGPLHYEGWYHLFYQYNPDSAVWGNITWGHAVSRDLIHWLYLPLAMVPDHWYDSNGTWSGSATFVENDRIVILYTGSTTESVQVQNLATPADPTDPLLLKWVKYESNPVLEPPPGIKLKDFRDPTTAWFVSTDNTWRFAIGSKNDSDRHTGLVLVYATKDFHTYELLEGSLHSVPWTGMWECVDFYPVATDGETGLDTSAPAGPAVRHVLKASLDDDKHDYYAIGRYYAEENEWVPDDEENDVGIGLRYDYGKYYASKTFYDPVTERRVLWGWSGETDSELADIKKGWASVQTIPRTVVFDQKTGTNILQWPVAEVESLRSESKTFENIILSPGSVVPLQIGNATQLDIVASFEIDELALEQTLEADIGYNCSTSGGAAGRGALGPFGLLVLADDQLLEQSAVYFYVGRGVDGGLQTYFCQDELRSTIANDVVKRVYGSSVLVLNGETLSVRMLVDHSIVESFAQGGRTCITSRVYPTVAIYGGAKLFLFNNATNVAVTAKSIQIWKMDSANIHSYFDDQES